MNEMSRSESSGDKTISLRVPVLFRSVPYVYIKMNSIDNRYRLSGNYKYLNEHYGLRMNMIRDFTKIDNHSNRYFEIVSGIAYVKHESDWQNWKMGKDNNILTIQRRIVQHKDISNTIMILTRKYYDETNSSIFFCSNQHYDINQFLDE